MAPKKTSHLKHGFKAKAERIGLDFREKLSLPTFSHLPAQELATFLGVPFFPLYDCGFDTSNLYNNGFSAFTMFNFYGQRLIVYNHFHPPARIQSDLMHELAHVICGHQPSDKYKGIPIPSDVRNYDKEAEAEAEYLGGCLQIPRDALIHACKLKMDKEQMVEFFNASLDMVNFRIRATGVERQVSRWKY
ncbi:MAG: ImmA/IrrE family metallo-endopeptidase [Bacteroidetes bacterium]|nr:ImmA/IrrE family metallo-endopeptidase [Bacteroidota bacterium]